MSLHWAWCIPVGILLATGIIVKDRWCSRHVAGVINLAVFLAGVALAVAWIWGVVPHRMIQTTRNTWQNFSVEPMAAGGTGLQIRALADRHHRSPLRS
jgi:hypothetical protein